ncbi:hypothetical protein EVG20_g10074, partial [Dentipellis fragilis]
MHLAAHRRVASLPALHRDLLMTRTIASAPKATSSSAPRKRLLDLLSSPISSAKRHQNEPEERRVPVSRRLVTGLPWTETGERPPVPDFCFICLNGGKTLVECDSCSATYCTACIDFKLTAKEFNIVFYFCHSCHELEEQKAKGKPKPYVGIYHQAYNEEGRLVRGPPFRRGAFLRIIGLPSGVPTRRIVATPLAIIHLHLSSCLTTSTDFCSSIVNPYFQSKQLAGLLSIHDIEFNLSAKDGLQAYSAAILQVADALKKLGPTIEGRRALIMISTHSDEERGDLFLENNGAYTHQDFFNTIIPPAFAGALAGFDATFLFLVCGAFVSVPQSLIDLRGMIANLTLPKPFLLHLLLQRFIHGYDLSQAIERILSESPHDFRRHTGVIHLGYNKNLGNNTSASSVFTTHYMWHSHTIMPWGIQIPLQCPECMCIRQWDFPRRIPDVKENVVVKCKGWIWGDEDGEHEVTKKKKKKKKAHRKAKTAASEDQETTRDRVSRIVTESLDVASTPTPTRCRADDTMQTNDFVVAVSAVVDAASIPTPTRSSAAVAASCCDLASTPTGLQQCAHASQLLPDAVPYRALEDESQFS